MHLDQMLAPLMALAAFVRESPDYTQLAKRFEQLAEGLTEVGPWFCARGAAGQGKREWRRHRSQPLR